MRLNPSPECQASEIVTLRKQGKSFLEIASSMKTSIWRVRKYYYAATGERPAKPADYIWDFAEIARLRADGKTFMQIVKTAHVSVPLFRAMLRSLNGEIAPALLKPLRRRHVDCENVAQMKAAGRTFVEIASALNVSVKTARNRFYRARPDLTPPRRQLSANGRRRITEAQKRRRETESPTKRNIVPDLE
jgi:DNA-binding CsgD family transcriptional regulator